MQSNSGDSKLQAIPTAGSIDVGAEVDRLQNELARLTVELVERDQTIADLRAHEQALADANIRSAMRLAELEESNEEKERELTALASSTARSANFVEQYQDENEQLRKKSEELEQKINELSRQRMLLETARTQQDERLALLESEVESVQVLQRMLFPDDPPRSITNVDLAYVHLPCQGCGSNWVHFFGEGDEAMVLLGDVHGHGIGRALISAGAFSLFSTIRAIRARSAAVQQKGGSPSDPLSSCISGLANPRYLLEILDQIVRDMGQGQLFFPLFASMLDGKSRTMRFANAGHCVPLIMGPKDMERGRKYTSPILSGRGVPLGADDFDSLVGPTATVRLDAGTMVVWYTCGIIDNPGRDGRPLGMQGLLTWLRNIHREPVDRIRTVLEGRLSQFFGGGEMKQDATIVVAKIN